MSKICKFTALASRDLELILDHTAEQSSVDVAESVLKKLIKSVRNWLLFQLWAEKEMNYLQD